jgi:hypothetical protein
MIDTPVLGLAGCHDRKLEIENAGTFIPPCCLVFVGQDRQSWPPANCNEEDIKVKPRRLGNQIKQVRSFTFLQMVHTHTHPWARKYNERLPVAREDMRKPSVHSAIRKSRTSRIKQRIRSERCFASFASCSSCSKTFLSGGCKQRRLKKIGKAWERLPPAISMVVYLLRVCPRTIISLSFSLHRPLHYV